MQALHCDLAFEPFNIYPQSLGICREGRARILNELVQSHDEVFDVPLEVEESLRHLLRLIVIFVLG